MLKIKLQAEAKNKKNQFSKITFYFLLFTFTFATACRYDMQDQPKYKSFKEMKGGIGSRSPVDGTVSRTGLREDKALYTGKTDVASTEVQQTVVDSKGNTVITTFPGAIDTFPIAVDAKTVERGEQRYKVFCSMCHGPLGNADGMIVRRGFSPPPTYHEDRLRNAPVGHFFEVISNGWGKMNGYASQIPVEDRWAIVAYIRALQISQNMNNVKPNVANTLSPEVVKTIVKSETATKPEVKTPTTANSNVTQTQKGGK
jgi:mono/diheme cytochrome c family protein